MFYRKQAFTCSVYRKTLCFAHRAAFPASRRYLTGARKAALRQWTKGTFLRTVPGSYYSWVITESYSRLAHSAPAPAHTPASRTTSDSLCGGSPCGMYSVVFNARCGFALPGTCCRDKAQSATSFRLNDRKQAISPKCSHAVRGSRVYRKRICSTEVSALRRPPGACGRDAACAGCFRCFCPAAAFARKIHNRQLCLISCGTVPDSALLLNITAHYGYSRCLGSFPFLGTGLKVTPCGTLPPPHSRPVASHMGQRLSPTTAPKLLPSFRSSFGLRLSACPADCFHPAAYRSFPAGRAAPLRGADGEADHRKL